MGLRETGKSWARTLEAGAVGQDKGTGLAAASPHLHWGLPAAGLAQWEAAGQGHLLV